MLSRLPKTTDDAEFTNAITAPIIALIGVLATFAAFWVQYQANAELRQSIQDQEKELEEQKKQQSIDRFEKIFFEMMHIHRENTRDFEIILPGREPLRGNKAIKAFLIEIDVTYWFLCTWKKTAPDQGLSAHSALDLINIAYLICFEGHFKAQEENYDGGDLMDPSKPMLTKDLADNLMGHLHAFLKAFYHGTLHVLQEKTAQVISKIQKDKHPRYPNGEFIPSIAGFLPGQGYREHLSGYFRHLFHTFKYLDDDRILTSDQKDSYADMLRAHISDEAQTLLYYNSLTIWGKVWWGSKRADEVGKRYSGMIMLYKLLRNVPLYQIPGEISPLHKAIDWLDKTPENITQKDLLTYFHYLDNSIYLDWALMSAEKGYSL